MAYARRIGLAGAAALLVLAAAGCGDDDQGDSGGALPPSPLATGPINPGEQMTPGPSAPPPATGDDAPAPLRVVDVTDAASLQNALDAAQAGDEIRMADGTYVGQFTLTPSGTADAPITLSGTRNAVIDGEGIKKGRTVELTGSFWRLTGFTVTNGQKGVMALGTQGTVIDGLLVHTICDEAIHLRDGSSDNIVRNCEVHDTGLRRPGFGEAVYIGQAVSNWTDKQPDRSDRNKILNNRLGPNIAAEHVDIKEGTTGGEVRGNVFDGRGQTGENSGESWVNAKGNDWVIEDNTGTGAYMSGFKTRVQLEGWGCGNVFRGNKGAVEPVSGPEPGWAFDIHSKNRGCESNPNIVYADNAVKGPGGQDSNVPKRSG
jgi:Chondroitinase B